MKKLKIFILILYVLSPVDVLPEAYLGPLGLIDDGGALLALLGTLFSEKK